MSVAKSISAIIANPRAHQQNIFSLLQSCSSIKCLTQIHSQILIRGFSQKNFLIVRLISHYTTYGYFQHAIKVFEGIQNPTTNVYNQMIRGYADSKMPQKSVELYCRMLDEGSNPDCYTFSYLVSACARFSMLREGEQVHSRVLSNGYCSNVFIRTSLVNLYSSSLDKVGIGNAYKVFEEMPERNVVTWNTLLSGYIRCQDFDEARRMFDEMPVRSVVSWTIMIVGYARNGCCRQALSLFREMRRARVELDEAVLLTALSACAEIGDLSLGKWIQSYVYEEFKGRTREIGVRLQNALIHMYSSCGVIEDAYRVFKDMRIRTVVSWTSMIIGFAKHGFAREALNVFKWMQNSGEVSPDAITFIGVLSACRHIGDVEEGWKYFKEMREKWAIEPCIEHYGCMIDLLSRAGFLDEAYKLIESMPMTPNDVVWGALLSGCMIHRNPDIASLAAKNLMMGLDHDEIVRYLVPLSNACALGERWREVAIIRQKMIEMGSQIPTGRSWVQINDTIHDFVAGGDGHKNASYIYEMLNRLTEEVRFEDRKHETNQDFVADV